MAVMTKDSVLIEGTVTDKNGQFEIASSSISPQNMLRVSFIGYKTLFVNDIDKRKDFEITLYSDSLILGDIHVTASNISQQFDRKIYFPQKIQLAHSSNGLDLIDKMQLPGIEVNAINQSITSMISNGSIQLRINDVLASVKDILALEASRIIKIEHIDMPGIRYGKNVAQVINIITRQTSSGISGGVNLYNSLSSIYGNDGTWLKMNHGKSEFGIRYSFGYTQYKHSRNESVQKLRITDNDILDILRQGTNNGEKSNNHTIVTTYNWTDPDKSSFQVLLSLDNNRTPLYSQNQQVVKSGFHDKLYKSMTTIKDNSISPSFQMNYTHQFSKNQDVSIYMEGNYANSNYQRQYTSDTYESAYNVDGKKYGLYSETNYEKEWVDKYSFSAGYRYNYSYTSNKYDGSTGNVDLSMLNHDMNIYAQFQGEIGRFEYRVGLDGCYQYFKEGSLDYGYSTITPNITLTYKLGVNCHISYHFLCNSLTPTLAELSEVDQWQNEYEVVRGNASIKPYRCYQNQLLFQYNHKALFVNAKIYYQLCNHCINENTVERVGEGDKAYFLYTKSNDSKFIHFQPSIYALLKLFDSKLTISGLGGINRHIVESSDYSHEKTSVYYMTSINAYLGKWQLGARYMSSIQSVFNEKINKTYPTANFYVGYKYKDLLVHVGIMNPFLPNGKQSSVENRSAMAYKYSSTCLRDFGNMLYVTLSWYFSRGNKHKSENIELRNNNNDTGIVK